jgi:hypothetical protein
MTYTHWRTVILMMISVINLWHHVWFISEEPYAWKTCVPMQYANRYWRENKTHIYVKTTKRISYDLTWRDTDSRMKDCCSLLDTRWTKKKISAVLPISPNCSESYHQLQEWLHGAESYLKNQ